VLASTDQPVVEEAATIELVADKSKPADYSNPIVDEYSPMFEPQRNQLTADFNAAITPNDASP
jgi:hypothetical protein